MLAQFIKIFSEWVTPVFLFVVIAHAAWKRINVFEAFIDGAKEGFVESVQLLPYILAIFFAIGIFRESGALQVVIDILRPVLTIFGVPGEVLPIMLVRPLSGSASIGLTAEVVEKFGPDSFIGRLGSSIYGSSETTLYVLAVYFASVGIKKARYSVAVGLLADLAGYIGAVFICYQVFK